MGEPIVSLPGNYLAVVTEILTADGPAKEAPADRAVTVRLDREIDVSRGDLFSSVEHQPRVSQEIEVTDTWTRATRLVLWSEPEMLRLPQMGPLLEPRNGIRTGSVSGLVRSQ